MRNHRNANKRDEIKLNTCATANSSIQMTSPSNQPEAGKELIDAVERGVNPSRFT